MTLRLALAQINTTVGDIAGNVALIRAGIDKARAAGAELIVFPELAVTGYPPEDLLLRADFVREARDAVETVAINSKGLTVILGTAWAAADLYNSAVVLHDGLIAGRYDKRALPTYGVFDEHRYFASGRNAGLFQLGDLVFGVSICEDIWLPSGSPTEQAAQGGASLLINLSASPYVSRKGEFRARMLSTRAADNLAFVAYCNLIGGQDELVFDGESFVFTPGGDLLARGPQFEEALVLADIDANDATRRRLLDPRGRHSDPVSGGAEVVVLTRVARPKSGSAIKPVVSERLDPIAEIYQALVTGTRDYIRKCGFSKVLIGLSGGIDSALTAVIAAEAVGPENVSGVTMPTRYSSLGSVEDSRILAARLGLSFEIIPIEGIFSAFLESLAPSFAGASRGIAEENLQPRIRGTLLMALSNWSGALVLTTGNKSEIGVGYSTLYGDTAGGYAVLKDVSKTLVYALSEWVNARAQRELIPRAIIEKAPSAELRPDQRDTDSLPDYSILDPILLAYIEENEAPLDIIARGYNPSDVQRVVSLVDRSEYKRRQSPPGVKITARALGRDWRLPLARRRGV